MLTYDEVLKGLKPQKMLADIISTVKLEFGFGGKIQNLQKGWKWTLTFIFWVEVDLRSLLRTQTNKNFQQL